MPSKKNKHRTCESYTQQSQHTIRTYRQQRIAAYLFGFLRYRQINGQHFVRRPVTPNGAWEIYGSEAKLVIRFFWDTSPSIKADAVTYRFSKEPDTGNTIIYFSYQEVLEDARKVVEEIRKINNL
jgi:hypothetical protein